MNRSLTSDRQWEDHHLPLNRANYNLLERALILKGYPSNKYSILEPLCQTEMLVTEKRKAHWVHFYLQALSLNINLSTVFDISNC